MRDLFALAFGTGLALSTGLSQAAAVAALPADGTLAYVQTTAHACMLGLWDSKDGKARTLAASLECPKAVGVTSHGKVLVLFDASDIRLFDLGSGKLGDPMPLPSDAPTKNLDTDALLAGYTPGGVLLLQLSGVNPDSSSERTLYQRKGDAWVVAEHQHCGSFTTVCPFKQTFEAKPLSGIFGDAPGQIWNDALAGDPYVTKREPASVTVSNSEALNDEGDTIGTAAGDVSLNNSIVFRVHDRYSTLFFGAQSGEDGGGTLTFGLRLVTPDKQTLTITDEQFDATIVGHHLLFYGFFDAGTRLYDLGDGKVVLDRLIAAGWLY